MSNQLEAAILQKLLPTVTKIRYAELASTCIILFDHVLTLDQEIRLIWRAPWSLGKLLFLVNRYYALCIVIFNNYALFNTDTLSNSFCTHWFRWQGATGVLTFIIAELILQLRLYALYFRNRRILACMSFICLGAAAGSSYVMGKTLSHITAVAIKLPLSGSTVCVPFGLPDNFYAFWIPMLISESFLCGLALYRGVKSLRPGDNILQSGKRIIEVLVRDSLYYFVIVFATYLTNAIIFLTRPDAEVEIPIGFAVGLSTVMSSRICLNVRGYIKDESERSTLPSPTSPVHSPRATVPRSAFASLAYQEGEYGDGSGEYPRSNEFTGSSVSLYPKAKGGGGGGGGGGGQKVVQEGAALGAMEMRELRIMRAESPSHLRMLSLGGGKAATAAAAANVIQIR